jgi:hypothetical protein
MPAGLACHMLRCSFCREGFPDKQTLAKVAKDNPQGTTYFVALVSNIINVIVGSLFSFVIVKK